MVDFEKNGAKSSLLIFLTTFVPKKSEMFLQMSISMSTPILRHCAHAHISCQTFEIGKFEFSRAKYFKMQITNVEL